mmetsp:Transcript_7016/g.8020  ORF Transcript_7016/g.8020 Transcript_7016/m.8020 type:complete len:93 (+) Transcript_7016:107-385(+)|eukprot:CAMPEP_0197856932 /NCGR_PEP_ID=MMETSP1438-20131217/29501_1 /TAXON_ID=1461541 /ORGANISM="Pterosperma sp., Strain CCMP1384" /LENGTH=92 /DNA_ID=CAMNT_0043472573 /DNA_START=94 /DNA_END=372 /DNA_ORIENTATION=+
MSVLKTALSTAVKEVRFNFCQTSEGSTALRNFVVNNYKQMKSLNPGTPILIRECGGVEPKVWVRMEKGQEVSASLSGKAESAIDAEIAKLCK